MKVNMHYGDPEHTVKNYIEIVIYKHGICGKSDSAYDIELSSIQTCRLWCPNNITRLQHSIKFVFKEEFDKLEHEKFYLLTIKTDPNGDFYISEDILDVSDDTDESRRLH